MLHIDIESLGLAERLELADVLYDSTMQAIDDTQFTPERIAELDRRLERLHSGNATLIPWDEAYARLTREGCRCI